MGPKRPAAEVSTSAASASAATPKRLKGLEEEPTPGLVPAQALPASAPTPGATTPTRPDLPPRDDVDADVPTLMRGVIRYVQHLLKIQLKENPKFFSAFQDIELHAHSPLEIQATSVGNDLMSFKHPWSKSDAVTALTGTNLYEAGGNIFWLNPVIGSGDEQICAGEGQSWELPSV